ncbi:MAG: MoaD/ThiS family protein [Lutibacter sp.]|nr:MoaD/ThiS family protein [Lutibacter sp.]
MKIQVLFFGITTDLVGENSLTYNLKENASIQDLKTQLISDFSNLKNINEFAIAVNEEYANDDVIIKDSDVVAIIPPVSGG